MNDSEYIKNFDLEETGGCRTFFLFLMSKALSMLINYQWFLKNSLVLNYSKTTIKSCLYYKNVFQR